MARNEIERAAARLVEQAISEIDEIVGAKPQRYADSETNPHHMSHARRKFTMKDAKPKAERAARLLREAWELLDPSNIAS